MVSPRATKAASAGREVSKNTYILTLKRGHGTTLLKYPRHMSSVVEATYN